MTRPIRVDDAGYSLMYAIRTEIGGIRVADLVAEFGTPLYVYDLAVIARQFASLTGFDIVRYAQKANSNLTVLRFLRQLGAHVDAVSAGEIVRALAAGFPPNGPHDPLVFTSDALTHESLHLIRKYNLPVNCGSIDMIRQLGECGYSAAVTLRINPGFGHGHHFKANTGGPHSKHGIWHEQLDEALLAARVAGLEVRGLHMHIGSGTDFGHLAGVCQSMERLVRKVGDSLQVISAGGGLPTPYRTTDEPLDAARYGQTWNASRARMERELGHALRLEVEPGRYLVAECGYLLTEIRAIKSTPATQFCLVDTGFNALARPVLYGSYHPIHACPHPDRPFDANASGEDYVVAGPLCESGDVFTQDDQGQLETRTLPKVQVGDWLIFEAVGAYGMVMASNYNSFGFPAEVCVEKGRGRLARRRQSLEELLALEEE